MPLGLGGRKPQLGALVDFKKGYYSIGGVMDPAKPTDDELEAVRKRAEKVMACENIEAMRSVWKQRWQKFELYEEGAQDDAANTYGALGARSADAASQQEETEDDDTPIIELAKKRDVPEAAG
ncbi:MAG: hypothetical protein SGPRY_012809 [Prymnesium sp.]